MASSPSDAPAVPLGVAVLTISDTRGPDNDGSGHYLAAQAAAAGHRVVDRAIVCDDIHMIRARLSAWLVDPQVEVIVTTGGTGLAARDCTPEAVRALFDREVPGFGELFRMLSYQEINTSALQSRALAGIANDRLVVCLPGSTAACRTAWERILYSQLDGGNTQCNFSQLLQRVRADGELAAVP